MKKKIIYFLQILFICGLCSCSNDENEILESAEASTQNQDIMPLSAGDGKYDVLGYGYDVTTEYLHYKSRKKPVLNVERFVKDRPGRFDDNAINFIGQRTFVGADYESYKQDMIDKVYLEKSKSSWFGLKKKKSVFNGEYKNSNFIESHYSFMRTEVIKRLKALTIDASATDLSGYLTDEFKEDLYKYPASKVINDYGTHVLTNIEIGGILKGFQQSVITSETSKYEKTEIVSGSGGMNLAAFGVKGGKGSEHSEVTEHDSRNLKWEFTLTTCGGSTNGNSVTITNKYPNVTVSQKIDQGKWTASVDAKTAVLVDIDWENTYPIYDFISDPIKKAELKKAFDDYLDSKAVEEIETVPLYRMYCPYVMGEAVNTFFTTSYKDVEYMSNTWNFAFDPGESQYTLGFIFKTQQPGTIPLYRLYKQQTQNTYLTSSYQEALYMINKWNYSYDYCKSHYILGYVYKDRQMETAPLYRMWQSYIDNTFCTTSHDEALFYQKKYDYQFDDGQANRILGYVLSAR